MKKTSFYITTTLPYVNADLHMGHALEFVRADVIARYKKLQGFDVFFNTGTDEHGMKIYEKALAQGKQPQEFVDESFLKFKESVKIFGMDEEILHFVRTTDAHHIKSAQEFWKRVNANGYIYKKNYEAKYCVGCEETKSDSELVNDECPVHPGRPLEIIEEENYFFKYSEFGEKLLKFYEENPNFVIPDFRFNEMKAFVSRGLQDFSISRLKSKMPWGIPVPGDEEHVMYVWFDALTNYISTLGWPDSHHPALKGTPPQAGGEDLFEKYWINGNPTQYCGKDNTRFQSAMWQAMLMAADVPNTHQIVVNGFITADGGVKMSKTLGNVADPKELVAEYGTDALRYFLLREVSSFEDSPFTMERFKEAYNSGLANGIGNLTSRIMTMAVAYGVKLSEEELKTKYYTNLISDLENFDINKFVNGIWLKIKQLDEYIQKNEPFKKIKTNKEEAEKDVRYLLFHLYGIALELDPILPETAKKIQELIKANKKPEKPLFLRKE
ncbi:methionine--tRNA ligase [Candidatus Nomurabacteria bacterium GWB1_40_6]|uniref:Methionine--tRNA ligase n=1 Tax=Candidatus Nomurabacteria bacterium GWB1_40_6 TaxID=1801727 RepID=A0A1F6TPY6_9BACT|nr:MAG: methionine--tRNA ligase [Candidatus Nomurabacteria bacterium GWB1_40_6]